MVAENGEFRRTTRSAPHRARAKAILRDHPEVRELFGTNPWSSAVIAGAVALQWGLAFLLKDQPWWLLVVVAWCVGALANHAMYVMIHDAGHNLIFRRRAWNRVAGIAADLVNVLPSCESFKMYHARHHSHLSEYDHDTDLPYRWEARLIGKGPIGKIFWFLAFPIFEMLRPVRIRQLRFWTKWTVVNWIAVFGVDVLLGYFWGAKAIVYLALSTFFGLGLHPLGARWVQEHYLILSNDQETFSYYGPLNIVACNIGYHNEHHDFPSIPWNRLPALKRMAPEYYDGLASFRSLTALLVRFIFDRQVSLFSRVDHVSNGPEAIPHPHGFRVRRGREAASRLSSPSRTRRAGFHASLLLSSTHVGQPPDSATGEEQVVDVQPQR